MLTMHYLAKRVSHGTEHARARACAGAHARANCTHSFSKNVAKSFLLVVRTLEQTLANYLSVFKRKTLPKMLW